MNIPWLNRVDRIYIPWKPSQVEHDQGSSLNPEPTRNNLGGGLYQKEIDRTLNQKYSKGEGVSRLTPKPTKNN